MTDVFDHPWLGGLFGDPEITALWGQDRQVQHLIAFEAAFTRALGQVGTVPQDVAEDVANRVQSFAPDVEDLRTGTARDGMPVPAFVAQLRDMAGENAKAVHTGATSQDVMDTALSLTLRDVNDLLDARLVDVSGALGDLQNRVGQNSLMGRTRMQAALPITVGDRVENWRNPLISNRERLANIRPQVERLQLAGPVGDRAQLAPHGKAIAASMAQELGLTDPGRSWHTTRESLVDYAGVLSLITGALGKLGQDICLMAQQGIEEVTLAGGGSSSAMAHKQNPILAELLVTLARYNATQLSGMHHALVHEQERSGAAWALEWMILPQMTRATARSLSATMTLCGAITGMGEVAG